MTILAIVSKGQQKKFGKDSRNILERPCQRGLDNAYV